MKHQRRTAYDAAIATISRLRDAGQQAFLAGGCVRDMLLQRNPKDYDIATDALPDRVIELFPQARKVGAKFGVVLTRKYGFDIEVATFRTDGKYSDGRRPDSVTFGSAQEDAGRRDFTVNGLFYDPIDERVIDFVGGQADIRQRVIRTIGDPNLRFEEDHLRLLRAVRFASVLEFTIDEPTLTALRTHASQLSVISPERIWMELEKMLAEPSRAQSWALLTETGLSDHLVPSWQPEPKALELMADRLAQLPDHELEATVGLAAVLLSVANRAVTRRVCRSLKMSNRACDSVGWLVESVPFLRDNPEMELADLKTLMAHRDWSNALHLLRADLQARGAELAACNRIAERASAIPMEKVAPPPLLTGKDLIALGQAQGPRFGEIVKTVYRVQLNEEIDSTAQARELARRLMQQ